MARVTLLLFLLAAVAATAQQTKDFEQTDSCGRCHVSSVSGVERFQNASGSAELRGVPRRERGARSG